LDILTTIVEFKQHLKAAGYAAATIDGYRKNLDQFHRFVQDLGISDMRKVTHQTIVAYQATVMDQPIAAESKALRLRPVKRLFEHLVATHKLLLNPAQGIVETCRKHRKIGPVLTFEQVKKLMVQPNLSFKAGIRDRTIMEVLYATAIRLDELLALEVYHAALPTRCSTSAKARAKSKGWSLWESQPPSGCANT
jgi:integrase/recombinase XerD